MLDLHNISIYSPFLSILAFCVFSFNWKQKLKWTIFILVITGVIVDIVCKNLAQKSISTIFVINIFTLIETQLVFLFFYTLFKKKQLKKFLLALSIIFLLVWICKNFVLGKLSSYDDITQPIEFILLLLLCLIYFFQKTKITETTFIYNHYEFWIVSALLIYCAGTFFSFFIPVNSTEKNADTFVFEQISRIGNILKSILIAIAFCINNKPTSNTHKNPNSMYYINDLKD